MAVDIFETENGIAVKPATNRLLKRYQAALKDRNLRRRMQRRLAKVDWKSVLKWAERGAFANSLCPGRGGSTDIKALRRAFNGKE